MSATWAAAVVFSFVVTQGCLSMFVEVNPKNVIVLPGQNVTVLCRVGVPIQYCRFEIPGLPALNLNPKSAKREGVSYYGNGLAQGQCGFTIDRVQDSNNGQVRCTLGIETESQEPIGTMELTVAKAPKAAELELSRGADSVRVYKAGETVHATCVVREGRPVANISWFLDDEPIHEDLSMLDIIDMAKDDLHTVVQNLSRNLQPSDNARVLRCVSHHAALTEPSIVSRPLDVKFPPLALDENPIDKFGYEIGKAGVISLEITANPKPHVEWQVRDQRIKEGNIDSTGRIEAEAVKELGRGRYNVTLRIAAITKQDTETQYILMAYNDLGSYDYNILISTSPEPEGLDLGIGSVIGIVLAILILILIVFVFVFARVTGRWCFAGNERRHIGESSDTESADVRPKELKLKLPAFLKRAKPAKNEEEPEEDGGARQDEPKEGIVYAELDLVSPNMRPVVKNDDDKTEYAEIVYTQKEEEKGEEAKEGKKSAAAS